jgi:hypothetical protein
MTLTCYDEMRAVTPEKRGAGPLAEAVQGFKPGRATRMLSGSESGQQDSAKDQPQ